MRHAHSMTRDSAPRAHEFWAHLSRILPLMRTDDRQTNTGTDRIHVTRDQ